MLNQIAVSCGEPAEGGGLRLVVDLSQIELADLVGAREDTVQRAVRKLRKEGLLRTGYRRIVVLDEPGLRALTHRVEWQ